MMAVTSALLDGIHALEQTFGVVAAGTVRRMSITHGW